MTFLNPFVLLGLAAAAIPIVLHLLNLQRLRTIEFSTLKFLKELQKTKIRRLKIRQLLLLILRTLLIISIVLAFARPTVTGVFLSDVGSRARTSALILIDDSYSMTASDKEGERFQLAKEAALKVVDLLNDGDEVWLFPLSQIQSRHEEAQLPQRNFAAVRAFIQDLHASAIHRPLPEAIRMAAGILSISSNLNKELYVISDFQRGVWDSPRQQGTPERLFPEGTQAFFIPIGGQSLFNLGLEEITIGNSILEIDKPFLLTARIRNSSDREATNSLVSVFLNGSRVSQKGVTVPSNSTAEVEFSIVPKSSGFLQGTIELEEDDAEFDNRRFFSVFLPEKTHVLLVGSKDDLRFIRLALEARGTAALQITESTPDRLTPGSLGSAHVVVLSNVPSLGAAQVELLSTFVKTGGGMIFFPGPTVQPNHYNTVLAQQLQLPLIRSIDQPGGTDGLRTAAEFEAMDLRHPLFQGMFEDDLSKSEAQEGVKTIPAPTIRSIANFGATSLSLPIVRLSSGIPFLLDHSLGRGKVILCAVSADLQWSDFPLQGLFVPLVHRSVSYLAQEQSRQKEVLAGEEAVVSLTGSLGSVVLKVRTPDSIEVPAIRSTFGSGTVVRYAATAMPGIYVVTDGSRHLQSFAVNINPAESNIVPLEKKEMTETLERLGIDESAFSLLSNASEIQRVVLQSRFGVELWQYFLVVTLLIAVAEMLVARDRKAEVMPGVPQGAAS